MNSESDASTVGNQPCAQEVDAVPVGSGELVRRSGYISCAKQMPKNGQRVLCYYAGVYGPALVTYWFDGVNHHFGNPPESKPATHWRAA